MRPHPPPADTPHRDRARTARRAGALGITVPLLISSIVMGTPPFARAEAGPGDGTVKVRVVREVNANGLWDRVLEPGMTDVTVTLTDDAGQSITGKTAADGTVTLNPSTSALTGGKYRVQVLNPKPGVLFSAFADRRGRLNSNTDALSSTEEFVDVSGGTNTVVTTAFWNPADYCQKNATLVTACLRKDLTEGTKDTETRTLLSFPYNARGDNNQTTNLSNRATTGALYGIGYSKQKKWIFSGAMARRGSAYGPGGPGAIYLTDRATGATTQFTTVPNAGSTKHVLDDRNMDLEFSGAVTKESLGDVEVSEDGKDLYVVNLNDRKLYRYDATQKTADAAKASYAIPDPGCKAAGDWRPFGLGVQDGVVYVGGVCSAESTQSRADLRAVIQTFDPATGAFTDTVMDQRLNYDRDVADTIGGNCKGGGWYSWADGWRDTQDGKTCGLRHAYPQPILGDIIVDTDGELILGFRDRYSDQSGYGLRTQPAPRGGLADVSSGGDLNRACKGRDGRFVLDGNGGCARTEFYGGDNRTAYHPESAFSGVALSKVEDTIASSGIDVIDTTYNSGTMWLNRTDGTRATGLGNKLTTTFGKGGSMADLEVLCDEAPIQIGNRVWYDVDKDGIQDPGERPVPGATVNLYDATGRLVATTTTTTRGEYYFDSVRDGLRFETQYTIKIDNPADYAAGGPLFDWRVTKNDAGTNDFIDSDGKVPAGGQYPEHTITTGTAGQDNHTYDFGYNQVKPDIDIEKKDKDTDSDADTETEKVVLPDSSDRPLYMDITNNGTEPLVKIEVGDIVTKGGAKVKDLKCDWPDGTSSSDPTGTKVRWDNTWAVAPAKPVSRFAVGATYKCTAMLTGLKAGEVHTDNSRVDGEGEFSQKSVKDEDPWNGIPPEGEVRVLKVDAKTKKALEGAEFQLWRETNKTDGLQTDGDTPDTKIGTTQTSGTDGAAKVGKLDMGTYYWQETKAPTGYSISVPGVFGPLTLTKNNAATGVSVTVDNHKPDIDIEKKDKDTNSDADTEAEKVVLPDSTDRPLYMDITNNGTEPLVKIEVGDIVTKGGAKVKDLKCDWPDGTSSSDPTGAKVRWDNTWFTKPDKPKSRFAVGATYKCTATLYGLKPGEVHTDNSRVDGEGEFTQKSVKDEDPWNGVPPEGEVRVLKVDAKTKEPLEGAVFQLWRETNKTDGLQTDGDTPDSKVGATVTSGTDGVAKVGKLDMGTYYWQETQAPTGYSVSVPGVFGPLTLTKDNAAQGLSVTVDNHKPDIDIEKKDKDTNSDADTEAEKVVLPDSSDRPLYMDITNNGTEPLVKIEVGDIVTKGGAKVKDLKCDWPDGTSSSDPTGAKVRWENTWAVAPDKPKSRFAVGATYKCTAMLTGLKPGEVHTDNSRVDGEGEFTQKSVKDEDPWNGIPPEGEVRVLKVDAKTKEPLEGAVFQLWRETNKTDGLQTDGDTPDSKVGATVTSGTDGVAKVGKLDMGTYYWQETQAPTGYSVSVPGVFGPLTLTKDNAAQGLSVTVDNHKPDIDIEKKDKDTNSDADTEKDKVALPDTSERALYMDITNNGTEPLVKIEVGDLVTKGGAKIKDLKCDWPDGTSSSDPTGAKVRWDNTWFTKPDKPKSRFAVGATYKCTATLYGLKPGEVHTDNSRVDGEGEFSQKSVKDEDPWNGVPPLGGVKVVKVDAKTKKPLEGAVFQLWRETNKTDGVQTDGDTPDTKIGGALTTDATGVLQVGKLDMGTYYWQETKAPAGYSISKPGIFGPLVLTKENANQGVSVTAVNHKPDIDIEKKDKDTNSDADTEKDKVVLPDTRDKTLVLNIVNNGTEPLIKIEVGDVVTKGTAKVRDLSCKWPDGTSSFDATGKRVRWDNSWPPASDPKAKPKSRLAVGAGYKCTARLTGLVATKIHGDRSVVDGEGELSGKHVRDHDPWYGIPPQFTVLKKDAKTKKPLKGAVFQLWREANGKPGLQMTGEKRDTKVGAACATNGRGNCKYTTKVGTYYLQETAVPEGYAMPKKPVSGPYKVTKNTKDLTVTLYNKPREETKKK